MVKRLCCGLFLVKSGQWVFLEVYVFLTILNAAQHFGGKFKIEMVSIFFFKNTQNRPSAATWCIFLV